jgi:F-type H+-transporting ATPase subunit b
MSFEQILAKVGSLIVQALPTLFLIVVLHFYLKAMLFKPLSKVLAERDALTKGAREKAEASLQLAEQKAAQYEKSLRDARTELYKEQETMRKQWIDDQANQIAAARAASEARLKTAREEIAADVAAARNGLAAQSSELADKIASSILG